MKNLLKFIFAVPTGAIGGWFFGFIILSFGLFIGRGGSRGPGVEDFGYWNPNTIFILSGFYGMPLGAIVFPVGYFVFLRGVPISKAIIYTSIGTLLGGLLGALIAPTAAALIGVLGFILAAHLANSTRRA